MTAVLLDLPVVSASASVFIAFLLLFSDRLNAATARNANIISG